MQSCLAQCVSVKACRWMQVHTCTCCRSKVRRSKDVCISVHLISVSNTHTHTHTVSPVKMNMCVSRFTPSTVTLRLVLKVSERSLLNYRQAQETLLLSCLHHRSVCFSHPHFVPVLKTLMQVVIGIGNLG